MRISIELFLLDNFMMNWLLLRLACAFLGSKPALWPIGCASAFGAIYALLSLSIWPYLAAFFPKLMLGAVMALPVTESWRAYPRALLSLYGAAFLMGGFMLALVMLWGGNFRGGALVCTIPIRIALIAGCLCACLPRLIGAMLRSIRHRALRVPLRVRLPDRSLELTALIDTGNLLTEPLSGLPVIIVRPGLLPELPGRPVPYRTVEGGGVLYAIRPVGAWVYQGYWHSVNAMVAESRTCLNSADAIVGAGILTDERWCMDANNHTTFATDVYDADPKAGQGSIVHSFGGDAAAAVWTRGGAEVDRTADA